MTITPAQFVIDYSEFANQVIYPVSSIQFQLNFAYLMLIPSRWSTMLDTAAELFTAHYLVLEAQAQAEAAMGAPPGIARGPIQSESVDKVSTSYTDAALELDGGHWGLTNYGLRFLRLVKVFGAGGAQV